MTNAKPARTWETRELRLLEVIALDEEAGGTYGLASDEVGRRAEIPEREVNVGMRALNDAGFIAGSVIHTPQGWAIINIRLTERGRRAVGQWPSDDLAAELLRILDGRIERAPEGDERTRLQRLRDAAADVGRGLLADALFELARGSIRF